MTWECRGVERCIFDTYATSRCIRYRSHFRVYRAPILEQVLQTGCLEGIVTCHPLGKRFWLTRAPRRRCPPGAQQFGSQLPDYFVFESRGAVKPLAEVASVRIVARPIKPSARFGYVVTSYRDHFTLRGRNRCA